MIIIVRIHRASPRDDSWAVFCLVVSALWRLFSPLSLSLSSCSSQNFLLVSSLLLLFELALARAFPRSPSDGRGP